MPPKTEFSNIAELPILPELSARIYQKVFTHKGKAGRPANLDQDDEEVINNERFGHLGDAVLNLIVSNSLQKTHPKHRIGWLAKKRAEVVLQDRVAEWSLLYGFPGLLDCHYGSIHSVRGSKGEQANIFKAYLGATFHEHGYKVAEEWIEELLGVTGTIAVEIPREFEVPNPVHQYQQLNQHRYASSSSSMSTPMSPTRLSSAYGGPSSSAASSSSASASGSSFGRMNSPILNIRGAASPLSQSIHAPSSPPPYVRVDGSSTAAVGISAITLGKTPLSRTLPNSSTPSLNSIPRMTSPPVAIPSAPSSGRLMLFHELCVKHKKGQPTWDFESTGPTNSRTWKASATVDGHRVGTGQGATKQIAKEDAAKQALQTLGWG